MERYLLDELLNSQFSILNSLYRCSSIGTERWSSTPEVAGSYPAGGANAAQAQADVRLSCKQKDAGSRPASGSNDGNVLSRHRRTHYHMCKAIGSTPISPTTGE